MPKLPDIRNLIRGTRQSSKTGEGKGITRRKLLQGGADAVVNRKNPLAGDDELEGFFQEVETALSWFRKNPKGWDPKWGPISEAEPEDILDAFVRQYYDYPEAPGDKIPKYRRGND
jgi:hypothetical protein